MATSEERAAIDAYGRLRSELASLADRAADLEAEAAEHALVVRTLEPMEPGRRAYRLVGDVLVERTVGEVLPAVQSNKAQLDEVIAKLKADAAAKEKELMELIQKYKIRPVRPGEAGGSGGGASGSGAGGPPAGVLV